MTALSDHPASIHVLGGRQFGGADQFYVRLIRALRDAGQEVTAINRVGSPVAQALAHDGVAQVHFPFANGWDAWTAWRLRALIGAREPCVVQTYMGRATRLTRLPATSRAIHIARLGGYYKIDGYYRHAHAWIGNTKALCDYLVQSGLPAERVFLIGNFVPDPVGASPAQVGITGSGFNSTMLVNRSSLSRPQRDRRRWQKMQRSYRRELKTMSHRA